MGAAVICGDCGKRIMSVDYRDRIYCSLRCKQNARNARLRQRYERDPAFRAKRLAAARAYRDW